MDNTKYIIGAVLLILTLAVVYYAYFMQAPMTTIVTKIAEKLNDISGNNLPQPAIVPVSAAIYNPTNVTNQSANELLPIYETSKKFGKDNNVTDLLKEQNFIIGGYPTGINTVLQSNKIPYLDIRSLPPIPKQDVGEWNHSSYEQAPGQGRRQFELGEY